MDLGWGFVGPHNHHLDGFDDGCSLEMDMNWNAKISELTLEQVYQAIKKRLEDERSEWKNMTPEQREKIEKFLDEAEDDLG